ncbi:MAG: SPFH domain-containing protein [Deltaproteobacteria bacterium]|jgi:membrane protease subunit (stomatin/prohibitin family)|nr:SPFH domain-containing protein [Deltaproteobacteria bacterium]
MAIVDVVKYDGPTRVLAWKFPNSELSTWTKLIVNESQEAIFFKGGRVYDVLGPGTHTLDTNNIPLLTELLKIPFGGQSPFKAEVWFVNKAHSLDIKWGTPSPIQIQDPTYKILIPVRSYGQFGVTVDNSQKFMVKLVGVTQVFDQDSMTKYFRGLYLTQVKDSIASYLVRKKISVMEINAYLNELSDHMKGVLKPTLEDYGITLLNFYVNDISVPEDDPTIVKLKDALAKKAEMDIMGVDYRQKRTFDVLEGAFKNPGQGAATGAMNLALGLETGRALAGQMGHLGLNAPSSPVKTVSCPKCGAKATENQKFCQDCGSPLGVRMEVRCDKCGTVMSRDAKFCPNCGDPYNPCPSCGADLPEGGLKCPVCGLEFPTPCPLCGKPLPANNAKFCPSCGGAIVSKCPKCQTEIPAGTKFCPSCGQKI